MSHSQDTITGAIARSISHDEIVTVTVDDIREAFAELVAETADNYDYVDTTAPSMTYDGPPAKLREVWSTDAKDGNDWRVHLLQCASR